jgi:hypothetical protein
MRRFTLSAVTSVISVWMLMIAPFEPASEAAEGSLVFGVAELADGTRGHAVITRHAARTHHHDRLMRMRFIF